MPEATRDDCLLGIGLAPSPLVPPPWGIRERCPAIRLFDHVGVQQTRYNLTAVAAFKPTGLLLITGSSQIVYDTGSIFHFALTGLFESACPGTGGEPHLVEATMQSFVSASGGYVVIESPARPIVEVDREQEGLTAAGRELALVRHYFSLSATDLSRVLLVERPTVYAWLDGKWDPNPENRGRIRKLFHFACNWRERSSQAIGGFLREPIDGDQSLFDHLVRQQLDTTAIDQLLIRILRLVDQGVRTKRDRSVKAIARQKGFKPLPKDLERESFDRNTRF
ncbi:MAG: hypothetical protein ACLQHT_12900 [Terracidiphilus sp.]